MHPVLTKIFRGFWFALVTILAVYGVYLFSGLFMVILLAATAPITMAWESLALDYSVWIASALVTVVPFVQTVFTHADSRLTVARRATPILLSFVIGGSVLIMGALLLRWPLWLSPAVPVVTTLVIVVGFYWYARKIKLLLLK